MCRIMRNIIAVVAVLLSFSTNLFSKNISFDPFVVSNNFITFYTLDPNYNVESHEISFTISSQGNLIGTESVSDETHTNNYTFSGLMYGYREASSNVISAKIKAQSSNGFKYKGTVFGFSTINTNGEIKHSNLFSLGAFSGEKRIATMSNIDPPLLNILVSNSFSFYLVNKKGENPKEISVVYNTDNQGDITGILSQKNNLNKQKLKPLLGKLGTFENKPPLTLKNSYSSTNWYRARFDCVSGMGTSIKGFTYLYQSSNSFSGYYNLIAPLQNKRQAMVTGIGY